jgi:polar amino acid transport system ATP-binding protein
MLIFEEVSKRWPDGTISLDRVSFTAKPGEITAIIGPSGAGKTTLLRVAAGLTQYDEGRVEYPKGSAGMVFQQPSLWPHLTLLENVALPLRIARSMARSAAEDRAAEALRVWGLEDRLMAYPSELSGGQQQRGAVVRTLCLEPKILCLDEITSALDPEITSEILTHILLLKKTSAIVLLGTHQLAFARQGADWILFVDEGRVVEQGTAEAILGNPKHERVKGFVEKTRVLYSELVPGQVAESPA